MTWLVVLGAASVAGAWLTSRSADMLDSPALVPSVAVLAVLCGVAAGFVPSAGPYWGLVPAVPYCGAFFLQVHEHWGNDASLWPLGLVLLLVGMAVPWLVGFTVGLTRAGTQRRGRT